MSSNQRPQRSANNGNRGNPAPPESAVSNAAQVHADLLQSPGRPAGEAGQEPQHQVGSALNAETFLQGIQAIATANAGALTTSMTAVTQAMNNFLMRAYSGLIAGVEMILKEDLDLPNHLSGLKNSFLKISFLNVQDLLTVRRQLLPRILRNQKELETKETYDSEGMGSTLNDSGLQGSPDNPDSPDSPDSPDNPRITIHTRLLCICINNI